MANKNIFIDNSWKKNSTIVPLFICDCWISPSKRRINWHLNILSFEQEQTGTNRKIHLSLSQKQSTENYTRGNKWTTVWQRLPHRVHWTTESRCAEDESANGRPWKPLKRAWNSRITCAGAILRVLHKLTVFSALQDRYFMQ